MLDTFVQWAERLSRAGLADVNTYFGKRGEVVLLQYLLPDRVGLVSLYIWPDGKPALQWWPSVFERRAPGSIAAVADAGGADIDHNGARREMNTRTVRSCPDSPPVHLTVHDG